MAKRELFSGTITITLEGDAAVKLEKLNEQVNDVAKSLLGLDTSKLSELDGALSGLGQRAAEVKKVAAGVGKVADSMQKLSTVISGLDVEKFAAGLGRISDSVAGVIAAGITKAAESDVLKSIDLILERAAKRITKYQTGKFRAEGGRMEILTQGQLDKLAKELSKLPEETRRGMEQALQQTFARYHEEVKQTAAADEQILSARAEAVKAKLVETLARANKLATEGIVDTLSQVSAVVEEAVAAEQAQEAVTTKQAQEAVRRLDAAVQEATAGQTSAFRTLVDIIAEYNQTLQSSGPVSERTSQSWRGLTGAMSLAVANAQDLKEAMPEAYRALQEAALKLIEQFASDATKANQLLMAAFGDVPLEATATVDQILEELNRLREEGKGYGRLDEFLRGLEETRKEAVGQSIVPDMVNDIVLQIEKLEKETGSIEPFLSLLQELRTLQQSAEDATTVLKQRFASMAKFGEKALAQSLRSYGLDAQKASETAFMLVQKPAEALSYVAQQSQQTIAAIAASEAALAKQTGPALTKRVAETTEQVKILANTARRLSGVQADVFKADRSATAAAEMRGKSVQMVTDRYTLMSKILNELAIKISDVRKAQAAGILDTKEVYNIREVSDALYELMALPDDAITTKNVTKWRDVFAELYKQVGVQVSELVTDTRAQLSQGLVPDAQQVRQQLDKMLAGLQDEYKQMQITQRLVSLQPGQVGLAMEMSEAMAAVKRKIDTMSAAVDKQYKRIETAAQQAAAKQAASQDQATKSLGNYQQMVAATTQSMSAMDRMMIAFGIATEHAGDPLEKIGSLAQAARVAMFGIADTANPVAQGMDKVAGAVKNLLDFFDTSLTVSQKSARNLAQSLVGEIDNMHAGTKEIAKAAKSLGIANKSEFGELSRSTMELQRAQETIAKQMATTGEVSANALEGYRLKLENVRTTIAQMREMELVDPGMLQQLEAFESQLDKLERAGDTFEHFRQGVEHALSPLDLLQRSVVGLFNSVTGRINAFVNVVGKSTMQMAARVKPVGLALRWFGIEVSAANNDIRAFNDNVIQASVQGNKFSLTLGGMTNAAAAFSHTIVAGIVQAGIQQIFMGVANWARNTASQFATLNDQVQQYNLSLEGYFEAVDMELQRATLAATAYREETGKFMEARWVTEGGRKVIKFFDEFGNETDKAVAKFQKRIDQLNFQEVQAEFTKTQKQRMTNWTNQMLATTGLNLEQIQKTGLKLLSQGLKPEEWGRTIADMVAKAGGGSEKLEQVMLHIGKMNSGLTEGVRGLAEALGVGLKQVKVFYDKAGVVIDFFDKMSGEALTLSELPQEMRDRAKRMGLDMSMYIKNLSAGQLEALGAVARGIEMQGNQIKTTGEEALVLFKQFGEQSGMIAGQSVKQSKSLETAWGNVEDIIGSMMTTFGEPIWGQMAESISEITDWLADEGEDGVSILQRMTEEARSLGQWLADIADWLLDAQKWDLAFKVFDSLRGLIAALLQFDVSAMRRNFNTLVGSFVGVFTGAVDDAQQWGEDIINNVKKGIELRAKNLYNSVRSVLSFLPDLFPHSPVKEGPLRGLDQWGGNIMSTLADSMIANRRKLDLMGEMLASTVDESLQTIGANMTAANRSAFGWGATFMNTFAGGLVAAGRSSVMGAMSYVGSLLSQLQGHSPPPIAPNLVKDGANVSHQFARGIIAGGSAINQAVGGIATRFSGLAQESKQWGRNISSTFTQGIVEEGKKAIAPAMIQVGQMVNAYLEGHSPPVKGPLSTIDQSGANVARVFTDTMSEAFAQTKDQAEGMLSPLKEAFDGVVDKAKETQDELVVHSVLPDTMAQIQEYVAQGSVRAVDDFDRKFHQPMVRIAKETSAQAAAAVQSTFQRIDSGSAKMAQAVQRAAATVQTAFTKVSQFADGLFTGFDLGDFDVFDSAIGLVRDKLDLLNQEIENGAAMTATAMSQVRRAIANGLRQLGAGMPVGEVISGIQTQLGGIVGSAGNIMGVIQAEFQSHVARQAADAIRREVEAAQEARQAQLEAAQDNMEALQERIDAARERRQEALAAVQEEIDAIHDSYAPQHEAYQAQLDAIQEVIDGYNDQADAAREAIEQLDQRIEEEVDARLALMGVVVDQRRIESLRAEVDAAQREVDEAQAVLDGMTRAREAYGVSVMSAEELNAAASLRLAEDLRDAAQQELDKEEEKAALRERMVAEMKEQYRAEYDSYEARIAAAEDAIAQQERVSQQIQKLDEQLTKQEEAAVKPLEARLKELEKQDNLASKAEDKKLKAAQKHLDALQKSMAAADKADELRLAAAEQQAEAAGRNAELLRRAYEEEQSAIADRLAAAQAAAEEQAAAVDVGGAYGEGIDLETEIEGMIDGARGFLEEASGVIANGLTGAVRRWLYNAASWFNERFDGFIDLDALFIDPLTGELDSLGSMIATIWQGVLDTMAFSDNPVVARVGGMLEALTGLGAQIWNSLMQLQSAAGGLFNDLVEAAIKLLQQFGIGFGGIGEEMEGLSPIARTLIAVIDGLTMGVELLSAGMGVASDMVADLIDKFGEWAKDDAIQSLAESMRGLGQAARQIYDNVIKWFQRLYDDLVGHSIITDLVDGVIGAFKRIFTFVSRLVQNLVGYAVESPLRKMVGNVVGLFYKMVSGLKGVLNIKGLFGKFKTLFGVDLVGTIAAGISRIGKLFKGLPSMLGKIPELVGGLIGQVKNLPTTISSFQGGVQSTLGNITGIIQTFIKSGGKIRKVLGIIKKSFGGLKSVVTSSSFVISTLIYIFTERLDKVIELVGQLGRIFKKTFSLIADRFKGLEKPSTDAKGMFETMLGVIEKINNVLSIPFRIAGDTLLWLTEIVLDTVEAFLDFLRTAKGVNMMNAILTPIKELFISLGEAIRRAWDYLESSGIIQRILPMLQKVGKAVAIIVGVLGGGMLNSAISLFQGLMDNMQFVIGIVDGVIDVFEGLGVAVGDTISKLVSGDVLGAVQSLVGGLGQSLGGLGKIIINGLLGALSWAASSLGHFAGNILRFMGLGGIADTVENVLGGLPDIVGNVIEFVAGKFQWLGDIWESITGGLSGFVGILANVGKIIGGVMSGLNIGDLMSGSFDIGLGLGETVGGIVDKLPEWFGRISQWFTASGLPMIQGAIGPVWQTISGALSTAWGWIMERLPGWIENIADWFTSTGWPLLKKGINATFLLIPGLLYKAFVIIKSKLPGWLKIATDWLQNTGVPMLKTAAGVLFDKLWEAAQIAFDYLVQHAPGWFDNVINWLKTNVPPLLRSAAETAFGVISNIGQWIFDKIYENLPGPFQNVLDFFGGIGEDLLNELGDFITPIIQPFLDLANGIKDTLLGIWEGEESIPTKIGNTLMALPGILLGYWQAIWDAFSGLAGGILERVLEPFIGEEGVTILSSITTWLSELPGKIMGFFQAIWDKFSELAGGILSRIIAPFTGAGEDVASINDSISGWATGLPTLLTEKFAEVLNWFTQVGGNILTALGDFAGPIIQPFTDLATDIKDTLLGIWEGEESIPAKIGAVLTELPNILLGYWQAIWDAFSGLASGITEKVLAPFVGAEGAADIAGQIGTWLTELPGKLLEFFAAIPEQIKQLVTDHIVNPFISPISGEEGILSKLITWIQELPDKLITAAAELPDRIKQLVTDFISAPFLDPIIGEDGILSKIVSFLEGLPGKLMEMGGGALDTIKGFFGGVSTPEISLPEIPDVVGQMQDTVGNMVTTVVDTISGLPDMVVDIISPMVDGILETLGGVLDGVSGILSDLMVIVDDQLNGIKDSASNIVTIALNGLLQQLDMFVQQDIPNFLSDVLQTILSWGPDLSATLDEVLQLVIDAFQRIFAQTLPSKVLEWLQAFEEHIRTSPQWDAVGNALGEMFNLQITAGITDRAQEHIDAILIAWNDAFAASTVWETIAATIAAKFEEALTTADLGGGLQQAMATAFTGLSDVIAASWNTAWFGDAPSAGPRGSTAGISGALNESLGDIFDAFNTIISDINAADIAVGGSGNYPSLQPDDFAWLAQGGIVTQPLAAIVAEDGPEAILPLEVLNNWWETLAKAIYAVSPEFNRRRLVAVSIPSNVEYNLGGVTVEMNIYGDIDRRRAEEIGATVGDQIIRRAKDQFNNWHYQRRR